MPDVKCGDNQISDRSDKLGKKRPGLILPGAVLVHEAFQQLRLLNQIGITLAIGIEFMIQKGGEGIESFKKQRSRLFHQRKKLFFGNDLG